MKKCVNVGIATFLQNASSKSMYAEYSVVTITLNYRQ